MRAAIGVPALLALDFQQRAARLKALAAYLIERKEALYAISHHTGATRSDGWIDIEGGTGTLLRLRRRSAATSCRPATSCTKGRRCRSARRATSPARHILVPRGGVAVHINAFNFPVWGLLEKFAPTFLAGMPCIAKPATATSYLTEAMVRLMVESGLLPEGQPAARDRQHRRPARPPRRPGRGHLHRLGRHRARSCARNRNLLRASRSRSTPRPIRSTRDPRRPTCSPTTRSSTCSSRRWCAR